LLLLLLVVVVCLRPLVQLGVDLVGTGQQPTDACTLHMQKQGKY
jgi:hypothetical protein